MHAAQSCRLVDAWWQQYKEKQAYLEARRAAILTFFRDDCPDALLRRISSAVSRADASAIMMARLQQLAGDAVELKPGVDFRTRVLTSEDAFILRRVTDRIDIVALLLADEKAAACFHEWWRARSPLNGAELKQAEAYLSLSKWVGEEWHKEDFVAPFMDARFPSTDRVVVQCKGLLGAVPLQYASAEEAARDLRAKTADVLAMCKKNSNAEAGGGGVRTGLYTCRFARPEEHYALRPQGVEAEDAPWARAMIQEERQRIAEKSLSVLPRYGYLHLILKYDSAAAVCKAMANQALLIRQREGAARPYLMAAPLDPFYAGQGLSFTRLEGRAFSLPLSGCAYRTKTDDMPPFDLAKSVIIDLRHATRDSCLHSPRLSFDDFASHRLHVEEGATATGRTTEVRVYTVPLADVTRRTQSMEFRVVVRREFDRLTPLEFADSLDFTHAPPHMLPSWPRFRKGEPLPDEGPPPSLYVVVLGVGPVLDRVVEATTLSYKTTQIVKRRLVLFAKTYSQLRGCITVEQAEVEYADKERNDQRVKEQIKSKLDDV